ncbi:serine/threonine dehydratase [Ktedonobacteria bacterium brp13]|nr:serine/threonine dehydratase [Ktedonobacteria bacterium brp13]
MQTYTTAPELTPSYLDTVWTTLPARIRPTLLLPAQKLSERLGCSVTIASETFQFTGSFKFRAAYNLLSSIPHSDIVAASSGNFGQAIAYASKILGKRCTIVMPATSAQVKIDAVRSYGGNVDLIDVHKISRQEGAASHLRTHPDAFLAQAYDDYRVVAGNSTLGQEIFAHSTFDTVIVPVGGGGLSSGIVLARDHVHADTEIIGVEPLLGNDAARSLRSGQLVKNEQEPATIADGARTVSLGQINWEILSKGLSTIIEVPDPLIVQALRTCFIENNLKVEPTGALSLAALLAHPERFKGRRVCCIVSGGNVDPAVYAAAITQE